MIIFGISNWLLSMIYIPYYLKYFREAPIYCIWEVKEGISIEEFQKFIDDPSSPGFGIDLLMNVCKSNGYIINGWTNSLSKSFS